MGARQSDFDLVDDLRELRRLEGVIDRLERSEGNARSGAVQAMLRHLGQRLTLPLRAGSDHRPRA